MNCQVWTWNKKNWFEMRKAYEGQNALSLDKSAKQFVNNLTFVKNVVNMASGDC